MGEPTEGVNLEVSSGICGVCGAKDQLTHHGVNAYGCKACGATHLSHPDAGELAFKSEIVNGPPLYIIVDDFTGPSEFIFSVGGEEYFRITKDKKVILKAGLYEAAKVFWDAVKQLASEGYALQVEGEEK